jgi:hypothetical protein
MARWRVEIIRARLEHLGSITAPTESLAITRAAEQFHIPPSRRNRIVVTKISDKDDD